MRKSYTFCSQSQVEGKVFFSNIVGKGENADNQHFRLFSLCFLPFLVYSRSFFFLLFAKALNMEQSKCLLCCKEFALSLMIDF